MKKESIDICRKLRFEAAKGIGRLQFLLIEYLIFEDSEQGNALRLSLPRPLFPLSLMLHILMSRALTLLRLPCFFVKLETRIIGLFAVQEFHESMVVASLGVAKEYRRLGIGTYILGCIETIAELRDKKWLEVDVLTKNIRAQRFYTRCGFVFNQRERVSHVMRGKKSLQI